MLRQGLFALATVAGSIAVAPAAQAARVLVEYSTVVEYGFDMSGAFGTPFSSLISKKALLSFTLNYPTANTEIVDDADRNTIRGGGLIPAFPGLPMTATITINGITRTVGQTVDASTYAEHINGYDPDTDAVDFTYHWADELGFSGNYYVQNQAYAWIDAHHDMLAVASLTAPLDYALQDGDESLGNFRLLTINSLDGSTIQEAFGDLIPYAVRITALPDVAGVPEPSSWAFMLAGFGMIGFTLRTRSKPIVAQKSA